MEALTIAGVILVVLQITLTSLQLRQVHDELRKSVKGTDENNGQVSSAAKSATPAPVKTEQLGEIENKHASN